MNPFELVNLIQSKMQNPVFARQFNNLISQLDSIPGLKQEVMRIAGTQIVVSTIGKIARSSKSNSRTNLCPVKQLG